MSAIALRSGLVIEDERIWSQILSRMLQSFGVSTTSVATGADAIDEMTHRDFDIVLLDLRLGDEDPCELVTFVKSHPEIAARTIVVTSYGHLGRHLSGGLPIVAKYEMDSLYPRLCAMLGERQEG